MVAISHGGRDARTAGRRPAPPSPPGHAGTTEPGKRFGQNLREHRVRAGLSQERLAAVCRLHRTEVSLLERGARDPRLSTIVRVAGGLSVPPAALLEGVA